MRVFPSPLTGAMLGFGDGAVGIDVRVHEGDVSLVHLRLLVHERQHALGAGHTHDDGVELLGYLVYIAGKLFGHVQEGHHQIYGECQTGQTHVGNAGNQEQATNHRTRDV